MAKKLVIVESPSKSKTIEKYLGSEYKVVSSKGHIRDLATTGKYGLGVEIEDNFKPNYTPIKGKKKVITELKKEAKEVELVILASDPDREGEAISWHIKDALDLKDNEYERVVFNEITKGAVTEAFKNARQIDLNLVNSQEARRILDRMIGFRLSKLMQAKTDGKSAGRVQSVALKLIVDREREIEAFKEEEYWSITAHFKDFAADLIKYKKEDIAIPNELEAERIINDLSKTFTISNVEKKVKNRKSRPAFITSTLQQEAFNKLNFSSKKTMQIAQKLYEGIDLADETVGLITYMRTDSTRLSGEFINATYQYIETKYGKEYVGGVKVNKKKDNVQDAHEAIRPTSIMRSPGSVKLYLNDDEFKLYRLIYYRALASLMADAKLNATTVLLDNNDYLFKATGQVLIFDGYLKVYDYETNEDNILPPFENYHSNILVSTDITKDQHFTKPPARYTEGKLIETMEKLGIGRPSTYSKTMDTLKERSYVNILEKKFHPTEIGIEITDKLQEFFSHLINVEYTASMETDLDKIAEGDAVWYQVLNDFWQVFEPSVKEAFDGMEKKEPEKTGELCPNCNNPLVIRNGRYGKFTACSNYPECKYIKQEPKEVVEICDCPNCEGRIIEKKSRKGKVFYGCNKYPDCKTAYWDRPTGDKCPNCGEMLTIKKDFRIKCNTCDYEK